MLVTSTSEFGYFMSTITVNNGVANVKARKARTMASSSACHLGDGDLRFK